MIMKNLDDDWINVNTSLPDNGVKVLTLCECNDEYNSTHEIIIEGKFYRNYGWIIGWNSVKNEKFYVRAWKKHELF